MSIDAMAENSKRRNVEPTSDVLDIRTRSADCSGLANKPLDGEFVVFKGTGKAVEGAADLTGVVAAYAATPGNELIAGPGTAGQCFGPLLRMVWSEDRRSDRSSLGDAKVPVIDHSKNFNCKLHLYNYDSGSLPRAGDAIFVRVNQAASAAGGTTSDRLVATVYGGTSVGTNSGATNWVVGHVVEDVATAGAPLKCVIYSSPLPSLMA